MKIYIAARYCEKERAKEIRQWLRDEGHEITSHWIDEPSNVPESEWANRAAIDLADINDSDVFLSLSRFDMYGENTGGRHFEAGYAYGWCEIPIIVYGQKENIFHHLATMIHVRSHEELREALSNIARNLDDKFRAPRETILQEAQRLVHGDRNAAYGHPYHDMSRTAKIWSAILGIDITPEQVGLCMCGVKISREVNKHKRDNLVDLAGYAETVAMICEYREDIGT